MSNDDEYKDIPEMIHEIDSFKMSGEHRLWLNVVERAIQDYIFFFDYVVRGAQITSYGSPRVYSRRSMSVMRAHELKELRDWLFDDDPNVINLKWVFDHCFDGDDGLLTKLRDRIREQHITNLSNNKDHPAVKQFFQLYNAEGQKIERRTAPRVKKTRWNKGRRKLN